MKKILCVLLMSLMAVPLVAVDKYNYDSIASHPRLLMLAGGEDVVRQSINTNRGLLHVHQEILEECDRTLIMPVVERVMEGKRLLAISRLALQRIYYLSYAYRMTQNASYAERAKEEMLAVSNFSDWNPNHFLDVGEMVMALGIGYDWLYDYLDDDTKKIVREAIIEKGFEPSENERQAWFYQRANNWNQVCNAGLVFGALAIIEDEPNYSKKIIDKALESNPFALEVYAPDGGYPEGYGYWGYGTSFQIMLIAALETALGSDAGLSCAQGFLNSARFMQFMVAPSGDSFNFGDTGRKALCNVMMFWCAAKLKDLSVAWFERNRIDKLPDNFIENKGTYIAEPRLLPSLLVFCNHLNLNEIESPKNNYWYNRGETPIFIYRGGWESINDAYLGVKGGSPKTSHAHMDAGSFVYEYQGVRWAMDLGVQSYITLESKGVDLWNQTQDGQRWDVFRLNNKAHNTLTVDGERHRVDSFAPIVERYETEEKKGASIDLTSTFGDAFDQAIRSVTLDNKDYLTVVDKIKNKGKKHDIQWIMVTSAEAKIVSERDIELSKNGIKMRLSVEGGDQIELMVLNNDPPNDYDLPNPGTVRVGFSAIIAPSADETFKVKLIPIE